tara:strand:+ start:712 stop:2583 length:1872 start_codon:yes stop_codon:yes gene_type:complete
MRYALFFLSVCIAFYSQGQELDVFSDKPLKQLYFRYAEGSLKKIESEKWVKRWGRFDGVVLKAFNEEVTGFDTNSINTLKLFKQTYPQKLLLLHFNGRASLPEFSKQYATSRDYLYFLGTTVQTSLRKNEDKSTLRIKDASALSIRKNLRNSSREDVVLVAMNSDGTLNWNKTEHAKLTDINEKGVITIERDILKTGKLAGDANQIYIAQHVAKGPFSNNSQRLWEYNWFAFDNTQPSLAQALPHFLNAQLSSNVNFFDGIQFDVLTEAHRTDNIGYPMKIDADANGKPDAFTPGQYDKAHQNGVYSFLSELREKLGNKPLILADGSYANQRATWLLNGIESESWPDGGDPELTQWSSGLNRHNFWREFSESPHLNYIKVAAYHVPKKGKIEPTDNNRRLIVAAGVLTDSAIVPAFRPGGLPFHKWPEFRKLKNIGIPKSDMTTLLSQELMPVKLVKSVKVQQQFKAQTLNNLSDPIKASHCLDLPMNNEPIVVKIEAKLVNSEQKRPSVLYVGNQNSQQYSFVGDKLFTSWFNFDEVTSPVCLTVEGGIDKLEFAEISYTKGRKIEARVFQKAVLLANNSSEQVALSKKDLSVLATDAKIEALMKGREEITIPAKDIRLVRF